jgi:hypothetical protein
MAKFFFLIALCGMLAAGDALAVEKLSQFTEKAPDLAETTKPAIESAAFKDLVQMFKKKRISLRFLTDGACTAKFVNAKDTKEYSLTAVPMASNFPEAAPPLAILIISDGKEFRAGWLQAGRDARGTVTCALLTVRGKLVAHADTLEMLKEPSLPLERGKAAISIAKSPEGDERILVLCRSPYAAKKEGEMESSAVIFYSGDLSWARFAPSQKEAAK